MSSDNLRFEQPDSNALKLRRPAVPFGGEYNFTIECTDLAALTWTLNVCVSGSWKEIDTGLTTAIATVGRDGVFIDGTRHLGPGATIQGAEVVWSGGGDSIVNVSKSLTGF